MGYAVTTPYPEPCAHMHRLRNDRGVCMPCHFEWLHATDPEYHAACLRRDTKLTADAKARREYMREYQRARRDALTEAERKAERAARREYMREHQRVRRAALTEAERDALRGERREYMREYRAKQKGVT